MTQRVTAVAALVVSGAILGAGCSSETESPAASVGEPSAANSASPSSNLPAFEAGGIAAVPSVSNAEEEELDGAYLQGYQFRVDATGLAELDTAVIDGTTFRAADGEKLVALRYTYIGQAPDGSSSAVPATSDEEYSEYVSPPTASILIDGQRTDIPDQLAIGENNYLLISVPEDARSIELEMDQAGLAQTLDLATARRDAEAPEILYRKSSQREETATSFTYLRSTVNRTYDLPFTFTDTTCASLQDTSQDTTAIEVSGVDLQYWLGDTPLIQATPSTALLQIVVEGRTSSKRRATGAIPTEMVSVTDASGASFPVESVPTDDLAFSDGNLYAKVPADITEGNVTLTLGSVPMTYPCRGYIDFGGAVINIPFAFD